MGVDPEAQFHVLAVDDMTVSSTESSLRGFSGHLPTEGGTLTANVTTMDSGSKTLEVLGLMEDQDISSPASTDKNQLVPMTCLSSKLVRHLFLWSYLGRNQDKGFLCQQSQTTKTFSL
ncbi:unnamed protein product [Musa acuminata subsp. burmannicoides]